MGIVLKEYFWTWASILVIIHVFTSAGISSTLAPKILVLNPVNLDNEAANAGIGAKLRSILSKDSSWYVLSQADMEAKFRDYGKNPEASCRDYTCSLDLGNVCQVDYALFGSISQVDNLFIFNVNLMDVYSAKVVWTKVGEVLIKSGGMGEEALIHRLEQVVSKLNPESLSKKETSTTGILGILDVSEKNLYSKVLVDRLNTHAHTSGMYNVMDPVEMTFLFEALKYDPAQLKSTEEVLLPLGEKLGVNYLIFSKLTKTEAQFDLQLSMVDIQKKKLVRDWPYKTKDFRKLLNLEDEFFSNLTQRSVPDAKPTVAKKRFPWKWVFSPLTLAASGGLAFLALYQNSIIDRQYEKYQEANSLQQQEKYQSDVQSAETRRLVYGITSGILSLGAISIVVVF